MPDARDLPEGRVATVEARGRALAVTHCDGEFAAFDNCCPHHGGPPGEGSIERGWLRCPRRGCDCRPVTGEPPAGFADCAAPVAIEVRGAIFVGLPPEDPHLDTVSDVIVETMVPGE